jgi:hypothetical protein
MFLVGLSLVESGMACGLLKKREKRETRANKLSHPKAAANGPTVTGSPLSPNLQTEKGNSSLKMSRKWIKATSHKHLLSSHFCFDDLLPSRKKSHPHLPPHPHSHQETRIRQHTPNTRVKRRTAQGEFLPVVTPLCLSPPLMQAFRSSPKKLR